MSVAIRCDDSRTVLIIHD